MNLCVTTNALSHGYTKRDLVVKGINLEVPRGSIYGFLGPNGAGKTTTLKILLGLIKPLSGEVEIFGTALKKNRVEILSRTGSLIESPSLYAHLSATENLQVWKPLFGASNERIMEVLKLVGLADTGKKKAGLFSLGMKQRLAIAAALLHSPELLILDEPTNGLDPQGIIEMRELLRKLNEESGVTIIVSSHLLAEVEKLVTHVGIIHHGDMKFQGTWKELQELQRSQQAIVWRCSQLEKAKTIIPHAQLKDALLTSPFLLDSDIASINRQLINAGIDVFEVRFQSPDLETIFLNMIQ
jgi:ABC-type multidrug transport system ATPase subunit